VREPLPIDEILPRLIAALQKGNAAVLVAPTGAGKTTRVPPALLAAGIGGGGLLLLLEPRRVAARAAARRMAEEGGFRLGEEVGYQVRFERRASAATRILVITEGILVQRLQADPFLTGIGAVLFDEIHERSLAADLALAMARRVQREVRPDLVLLAMSATLDPGPLAAFLGGPVIESRGRQYPVEIRHLERPGRTDPRALAAPSGTSPTSPTAALTSAVVAGVERMLAATATSSGDVLVFLPGVGEIQRAGEALAPLAVAQDLAVLPLYGDLPPERQDEVLHRGARRRVVLATNVAETSITLDGVGAVVDSGLVRRLRYDPSTGLDRLELGRISRASADQRAGRAGRQGPGICLRLWGTWEEATLPARETPEIARVDLASPALQLLAWGEADLERFGWFEAPDPAALAAAQLLLTRLGAVDTSGVTALGQTMARLPVHPRLARLLIAGHTRGWTREAALLAALLAERDPFANVGVGGAGGDREARQRGDREARQRAVRASRSDLLDRLEALEAFEDRRREPDLPGGRQLHRNAARFVLQARDQLVEIARRELSAPPTVAPRLPREEALLRALLAAFPDRLARRREPRSPRALLVGGRGVRLADESAVKDAELFVAVDLDDRGSESLVRLASAVELAWLPPERLTTAVELRFDPTAERVIAWKRTRYEDLVLAEAEANVPVGATGEVERLLAEAAAGQLDRALPLDDPRAASFLVRVRCLAGWMPELGLPTFGAAELQGLLPILVAGRRSFADLKRAPLLATLEGALTWEQREALRREAPERLTIPGGRSVPLTYEEGRPPVLAARIQQLFGLAETPRIAALRVPVLLHLLAPNGRPQQVTQDLRSFWATTYREVRKELQGRYPKHAWPEDPWKTGG
jgi:ATP-dependent helicase HrpB